jgi:hypothetical protein
MSEPTGGDNQKPDQDQGQAWESDFSDPTAPVWADPTAPIPTPSADQAPSAPVPDAPPPPPHPPHPPAPPGAAYPYGPYGQQPAAPQGPPPAAPPMSNPYAQQPPVQQYGQQAPAYGQQPPVQQYGQQAPAYGQQVYGTGAPTEANVSAIILTIVSALAMFGTCVIGIPSLIFGIIALTANSKDPVDSRKKAKTGWIVFGVNVGIVVLVIVIGLVIIAMNSSTPRSGNSI